MTDIHTPSEEGLAEMSDEDFEKFLADRSGAQAEPPEPPREPWRDNPWLTEGPEDRDYRYRPDIQESEAEPEPFDFGTLDEAEFAAVERVIAGTSSFTDKKVVRELGIANLLGDR